MNKRPKLRTPENAERICELLAAGRTLRQAAGEIGFHENTSGILNWARDDAAFRDQYARARDAGCELLADELVEISDSDCTVDGKPDNALVQQARLRVDTRKWLLSKMLPKKYGDRVTQEITGDANAPLITRIELVPVSPRLPKSDEETACVGEATVTPLRALPSR